MKGWLFSIVLWASVASACAALSTTCAVIDVADQACEVYQIRYRGPDGVVRTEAVPAREIAAKAEQVRLARGAR